MEMTVLEILAKTIGFIIIFKTLLSIIRWVWANFLRPQKDLKEYGSWALVTGSTDGIGKALAFELASKGLHLILVGRNPTKLSTTTKELHRKYHGSGLQVRTVVADFSTDSLELIGSKIKEGIDGLDVGILINNAGMCNAWPRFFHEADSIVEDIIRVNVESMCRVARAVLPVMLKKNRGAIINIGSGSAVVLPSFPLYSVYSATKAYVLQFSRSLHVEYKQYGIDIQCQIPLLVKTKMLPVRISSFFIPTPEVYSRACLRWIGYDPVCLPYWRHSLQGTFIQAMPKQLLNWVAHRDVLHLRVIENSRSLKKQSGRTPPTGPTLNGLELEVGLDPAQTG